VRVTPYELLLEPLVGASFQAIRDEAEARHADPADRDAFLLLGHAGAVMREMLPDDADAGALEQCAELLWHAWRFWDAGARLYALSEDAATRLLAPTLELGAWRFAAPPACYIQLPYQRVWSRVGADAAFEPLDGCFVSARALTGDTHEVRMLMVLGLRRERPGISLVAHRAELRDDDIAARARHPGPKDAEPFANAIAGGERKGYRSITAVSELEAFVLRALHELDTNSRTLTRAEGSAQENESHLPHVLVS
jgi:hypothetical protein